MCAGLKKPFYYIINFRIIIEDLFGLWGRERNYYLFSLQENMRNGNDFSWKNSFTPVLVQKNVKNDKKGK